MNIRPIGDKVLLLFPQEGRIENGIWVEGETARRMDATVVAKGNGCKEGFGTGDVVLADRLSGEALTVDGVEFRLVRERDVQAVQIQDNTRKEHER